MKIGIFTALFILFAIYESIDKISWTNTTNIRVINHSEKHFSNVMLFSMKFEDLKPKDTSAYKVLDFDILSDDPLIYCSIGDTNFARYLKIPVDGVKKVSYVIDSIQNDILYISTTYEE
ncbi:hypothetical protein [Formosa sp. PL04]|uniref:hypothetical protein n=1 Tax=Formosa sp. PL04 TaxID=3081755 RepID=UPI002980D74C|nr:hypothetical protein [Formosa sp. PL04]MDW5290172.1 hypothetical protein [Formosa sp. PL04]